MTNADFYQHFDRSIPNIQRFARQLANDIDTARYLYQETAHQAIKNRKYLKRETFEKWLMATMEKIYYTVI